MRHRREENVHATKMFHPEEPQNDAVIPEVYEGEEELFPLLRKKVSQAPGNLIRNIDRSDLDQLVIEQRRVFERCTIPEMFISEEERQLDDLMVQCLHNIDFTLEVYRSKENTSMLDTYRRSAGMPENLQLLLKMTDPTVRTGKVRCFAVGFLCKIILSTRAIWKTKLSNKKSFTQEIIKVFANILDPTRNKHSHHVSYGCTCESAWSMLIRALSVCTDPPADVIDVLNEYNWYAIFELNQPPVEQRRPEENFTDIALFVSVHQWPVRLTQLEGKDCKKARDFFAKIGTCHRFYRRQIERIARGKIWSRDHEAADRERKMNAASGKKGKGKKSKDKAKEKGKKSKEKEKNRIQDMSPYLNVLQCYTCTLTPVLPKRMSEEAIDELDALVARAYKVLTKATKAALENEISHLGSRNRTVLAINENVNLLSDYAWKKLKSETEEDRWYRFDYKYMGIDKKLLKKSWKEESNRIREEESKYDLAVKLKEHNMCANCFTLESSLERNLFKCSGCNVVLYCSVKCQKQHWKKVHRKHCKIPPTPTKDPTVENVAVPSLDKSVEKSLIEEKS